MKAALKHNKAIDIAVKKCGTTAEYDTPELKVRNEKKFFDNLTGAKNVDKTLNVPLSRGITENFTL